MAKIVIIHVVGDNPLIAKIKNLPKPTDQFIEFTNPKRKGMANLFLRNPGRQILHVPLAPPDFIEVMTTEQNARKQ